MGWGRWTGPAVVGLLLAGPRPGGAVELRGLRAVRTPRGAVVQLALSARTRAVVREVAAPGEPASRLYIDLPAGTRFGPGVVGRGRSSAPPVTQLRAGLGDGGVVRVVVDLAGPVTYRLDGGRRLVTLSLIPRDTPRPPGPTHDPPPEPGPPVAEPETRLATVGRPKIVLDPGHGGQDPGAQGFAVEKDVTLLIAQQLADLLHERAGADVILTRADDATLTLAERTARANTEGADLFVSIHANASPSGRLHGVETYYLDNSDDHATIRLAAMENGLDLLAPTRGETDLRYILSDLVQVGKMEESIALATAVQRGLVGQLRRRFPDVTDLGVKQGPFYVLVGAYMPCVLVETSFLDHPREGRRLAGSAYQEAVAEGLYRGVAQFLAVGRRARTL